MLYNFRMYNCISNCLSHQLFLEKSVTHHLRCVASEKAPAKTPLDSIKSDDTKRALKNLPYVLDLQGTQPLDSSVPLPPRHLLSKKGIQVLEKHHMEAGQLVASDQTTVVQSDCFTVDV